MERQCECNRNMRCLVCKKEACRHELDRLACGECAGHPSLGVLRVLNGVETDEENERLANENKERRVKKLVKRVNDSVRQLEKIMGAEEKRIVFKVKRMNVKYKF